MLTHEELMEKCQELRQVIDALLDVMRENGGIYYPDIDVHGYYMFEMIYMADSLWSIYLENRDSISDEDAKEIIRTIVISGNVAGFAAGTMDIAPEVRMTDVIWNKLK